MGNAIVQAQPQLTLAEQMQYANTISKGSLVPKAYQGSPANILIAMDFGRSMGLSPAESLYRNAGRMLAERNGTDCERFAVVNARSGDIVADTFGHEPTPHGARLKPTESKRASECADGVVTVHNHPASVYPSYADIKMTVANRNVRGSIVACHDGDVYLIEADKNWAGMEKRYWEIYTEKRKELVDRTRTENAAFGQLEAENEVRKWFKITRL